MIRYGLLITGILFTSSICFGEKQDQKIHAFVSIAPQAYLAEQVGKDRVEVGVLVEPGQSPHTFEPTPKILAELSDADVYLTIDMPFEQTLVRKIKGIDKNLKIVNVSEGLADSCSTQPDEKKDVKSGCEHKSGKVNSKFTDDPHTWLNPRYAKIMAKHICRTFISIDPENKKSYRSNLTRLTKKLTQLDKYISSTLAPYKGQEFFVFHAAFGHFGRAYGLKQVPVQIGGKQPSAKELAELIEKAKSEDVKIIFVQPQFSTRSAKAIANSIDGVVVPIDPLAHDYISNLRSMADKISKALKPATTRSKSKGE